MKSKTIQHKNKNKAAKTAAPVATSSKIRGGPASIKSVPGGIRVKHREFFSVMTTTASVDVSIWAWTLQPGYAAMFPWLSGIATRFERYSLHGCTVRYVPRVPTSTLGTICLAMDQDPTDPMPTEDEYGRVVMLSHQNSVSASCWTEVSMKLPGNWEKTKNLFVRTNQDSNTVEPRTADAGVLFVGLFGTNTVNSQVYGDLIVEYDISFMLPQLHASPTLSGIVKPTPVDGTNLWFQSALPWMQKVGTTLTWGALSRAGAAAQLFTYGWIRNNWLGTGVQPGPTVKVRGDKTDVIGNLLWDQVANLTDITKTAEQVLSGVKAWIDVFNSSDALEANQPAQSIQATLAAVKDNPASQLLTVCGEVEDLRLKVGQSFSLRFDPPSSFIEKWTYPTISLTGFKPISQIFGMKRDIVHNFRSRDSLRGPLLVVETPIQLANLNIGSNPTPEASKPPPCVCADCYRTTR